MCLGAGSISFDWQVNSLSDEAKEQDQVFIMCGNVLRVLGKAGKRETVGLLNSVDDEIGRSSLVQHFFAKVLTSKSDALFLQPTSYDRSHMDMALYKEFEQDHWEPVLFFEFTLGRLEDKLSEVRSYACNLWNQLNRFTVPLCVVMNLSDMPVFQVLGFPLCGHRKVATVSIVPPTHATSVTLAALFKCLVWWKNEVAFKMTQKERQINPKFNPKVIRIGNSVFKHFPSNLLGIVAENLRATPLNFVTDWCKYPFVDGTHMPTSPEQFAQVLQHLARLHSADPPIVHGDIRLSNIVFGEKDSKLIDFDLSGVAGQMQYPLGFNVKIQDGKRHPGARKWNPLQIEHDRFSMAFIMKQYVCKKKQEEWKKAIQDVEGKGDLATVAQSLVKLKSKLNPDLSVAAAIAPKPFRGTGSPPCKSKSNRRRPKR